MKKLGNPHGLPGQTGVPTPLKQQPMAWPTAFPPPHPLPLEPALPCVVTLHTQVPPCLGTTLYAWRDYWNYLARDTTSACTITLKLPATRRRARFYTRRTIGQKSVVG